jgi:hypothetical protein
VKARESIELIIGAVIGPINRPESIVAGLYRDGTLVIAGRSVLLTTAQSRSLATVLTPALGDHPWPDTVASNRFGGGRDRVTLTKVEPTVVAEVLADSALQAGIWRHPLRFIRYRPDLTPEDLPPVS